MKASLGIAALIAAAPASASVSDAKPNSFIVTHSVELAVPAEQAFRDFAAVASWWNPDHSYSGTAANLSLDLKAGGCFCETLEGGGAVEHLRVAMVQPGKRLVLTGGLGPLLFEAVAGTMDVQFKPSDKGTTVVMDYRVAGFASANGETLAGPVDQVLGEQMRRFAAFAERD